MNDSQMNGAPKGPAEISELTRLLPPPAAPELTDRRSQALRAHLVAQVAGEQRGPARRPGMAWPGRLTAGLAGAVAVGAAAAVGVSVLAPAGGPGSPSSGASPAAVTLLAKVANAAARQPEPKVSDSQFVYVRSQVAFEIDTIVNGHERVAMVKPHERQVWLPVASVCAPGLLIEKGQRTPLGNSDQAAPKGSPGQATAQDGSGLGTPQGSSDEPQPVAAMCRGGVNDPTYRFLQSLPADPRTLLGFIYDQTKGEGQANGRDGEAFTTIGDLIRESIVPPKTAAALYRAAALIPGVTLVEHAANAVGQPGIAVSYRNQEWIFDPATYQFIGERDGSGGESAILQQAFVARLGQLP